MQNLNDLEKLQQVQKMPQMTDSKEIQNLKIAEGNVRSRFSQFAGIVWFFVLILLFIMLGYIIIKDHYRTQNQIKANMEAVIDSPKMQQYRMQQAKRQREIEKQKRLKQLGIDGISKPAQKNDLLNQQIRKQEIAEQEQLRESQKTQGVDYTSELAAYKARLKEVQAEEARLRAQAE